MSRKSPQRVNGATGTLARESVAHARAASTGCVGTGDGRDSWNIRAMDTYLANHSHGPTAAFEYMHNDTLMRIDDVDPYARCTADEALRAEVSCGQRQ